MLLDRYLDSRIERHGADSLENPAAPLFVHYDGTRLTRGRIHDLVERIYKRARLRATVAKGALVHALRHTFASQAIEYGADVVELRDILGHASLATTSRSLDANAQRMREAKPTRHNAPYDRSTEGLPPSDDNSRLPELRLAVIEKIRETADDNHRLARHLHRCDGNQPACGGRARVRSAPEVCLVESQDARSAGRKEKSLADLGPSRRRLPFRPARCDARRRRVGTRAWWLR